MITIPPAAPAQYWQLQTQPDCVEETVRIAIAVHEHKIITEGRLDAAATTLDYYTPGAGTHGPTAIPALLHHYNLHAHQHSMSHTTLVKDLLQGDTVIAVVNDNQLWNPHNWEDSLHPNDTTTGNHAVTITAVVGSYVEVTDTGVPFGQDELIPWTTFSHAWSTSNWLGVATW